MPLRRFWVLGIVASGACGQQPRCSHSRSKTYISASVKIAMTGNRCQPRLAEEIHNIRLILHTSLVADEAQNAGELRFAKLLLGGEHLPLDGGCQSLTGH